MDSKYHKVLNMRKLQMVLNEVPHNRYLTGFEFWICQCYTGFCRKRSIISARPSFENSSGYQYARAWIYKGCEYDKGTEGFSVNYILKIHGILNVLSSEYARVLNLSGV